MSEQERATKIEQVGAETGREGVIKLEPEGATRTEQTKRLSPRQGGATEKKREGAVKSKGRCDGLRDGQSDVLPRERAIDTWQR